MRESCWRATRLVLRFGSVSILLLLTHVDMIEQLCNDDTDNDEDCLVDGDDPDCQM